MSTTEADLSMIPGAPQEGKGGEGEAPKQADPKADRLAEVRAKFDEVLRKQRELSGEAPEEKPKRAAKKKEPKPATEAAPEKAQAAPESEETPEEAPKPKRDPEVDRLRRKLRLTGTPEKAIESLSDAEVREWWETVEERERSAALALERASRAEKELKGKAETTAKSEPLGVPTDGPDLDAIARDLADQFGEDEAGTILKALKKLVSPLQEELGTIKQVFGEARERTAKQIADTNRKRLSEQLPDLAKNDRAWDNLNEFVLEAFEDDPSRYATSEEAYDDAFQTIYGGVLASIKKTKESDFSDDAEEVSASDLTPPRAKSKPRAQTPEEAAFAVFKHLRSEPGDVDGAKRVARRAIRV